MNLATYIKNAQKTLATADIDNASLDARLLIAHALDLDRLDLVMQSERALTPDEKTRIHEFIERRAKREPVGRILGLREFWGLPFELNEATLEPRPDSETLIEAALEIIEDKDTALSILDLGTGTGCLLLSLLHELKNATGVGVDLSPLAVEQATANAARIELNDRATFQAGNWLDGIDECFDLIISNPPYIKSEDIKTLSPEVKEHDPMTALDGGDDGYDPYRHLIPRLPKRLNAGGISVFEIGQDQEEEVSALMKKAGFINITTHKDLGGIIRVVMGKKPR